MLDKELAKPKSTIDIGDFGIFGVSDKFKNETRNNTTVWLEVIILICCILHLLSGICILLGLFLDMKIIFSFGKGMSHVLPWVGICSIILPIVQLICLFRVCRYYKAM
ncbi:uncharacterized protein DMAD_02903 [Drosophila madeirensis]|uniref:Transmembrane protein n=1 Tax=Drosophila madeirensis TaxID=30013 RepID=A0AAU9G806_DROMD